MNSKVAQSPRTRTTTTTTIFKLIGPCEILSHGQKTSTRNWMKDNERKLDLLKVMKKSKRLHKGGFKNTNKILVWTKNGRCG